MGRSLLGCLILSLPHSPPAAGSPSRVACSMPLWALQPSLSWYVPLQRPGRGVAPGVDSSLHSISHLGLSLPGGHLVILSPSPHSTGPPGEHAHRNHRLQQAHGSRWHLRQVQEAEGRVRGRLCDLACGQWDREGGLWPLLESGFDHATDRGSLTLARQGCRPGGRSECSAAAPCPP